MKIFKKIKIQYKGKRFWKAIRVQARWALRRTRNGFRREHLGERLRGRYALRLYTMLGLMAGIFALTVASSSGKTPLIPMCSPTI